MARIEELLDALPEGVSFELDDQLATSLSRVEARYAPACMASCDLAFFCREEARACGSTDLLGRQIRDQVGGVETVRETLGLADGSLSPSQEQAEVAALLRDARRIRREVLS
jgi:hypothetical protein